MSKNVSYLSAHKLVHYVMSLISGISFHSRAQTRLVLLHTVSLASHDNVATANRFWSFSLDGASAVPLCLSHLSLRITCTEYPLYFYFLVVFPGIPGRCVHVEHAADQCQRPGSGPAGEGPPSAAASRHAELLGALRSHCESPWSTRLQNSCVVFSLKDESNAR